jgi:hypothetical protein
MFKFRRGAAALVGGGTLALTSIVGLGTPAQAATGAVILVPITFTTSGSYVLPLTFKAGDCRQYGQDQAAHQPASFLTVEKSATTQNLYTITWNATLSTQTSPLGDVWHQKFVFRSAAGPVTSINFDSFTIGSGHIYFYEDSAPLLLTPEQANSITFVDWIGDC